MKLCSIDGCCGVVVIRGITLKTAYFKEDSDVVAVCRNCGKQYSQKAYKGLSSVCFN